MGKDKKRGLFEKKEYIWLGLFLLIGFFSLIFFDSAAADMFASIQTSFLSMLLSIFKPMSIIVLFGVLAVMILWKEHRRKLIWPFACSLIISSILSFVIKFYISRERPFGLAETIAFTNIKDYSFPSSHTMTIFSALPILDRELRRFKWVWIAIACLIALSRLYFGAHYLSDVIFGGIFGYVIGKLVLAITERRK